ncbi:ATP-binding protein [Caballeronia sp. LjRoot29]|uniref:ATP-binding protein n=1 Tax=Caballeronia sp. LjRoot29 TaxID=3342315 RepID=UPI003ECEBBEE
MTVHQAEHADHEPPLFAHQSRRIHAIVAITDTGAGMSPEVLARSTDPFFTTKPRGKGTRPGLRMVCRFGRQMGGDCLITSVPGEGTQVTLYLRCAHRVQ